MPRRGVAVVAAADFEPATHAAAQAIDYMVATLERYGWAVEYLRGADATPENFTASIARWDPALVLGEGHGSPDVFTLQDKRVAMRVCSAPWVHGRAVFLQSCETGQRLGRDVVGKGALAFLGYTRDFLWMQADASANPLEDRLGRLFWEPVAASVTLIAAGRTLDESHRMAYSMWSSNLDRLRVSLDPAAPMAMMYIENDRQAWVLYGDGTAALAERAPVRVVEEVPLSTIALALLPPALLAGVVLNAEAPRPQGH